MEASMYYTYITCITIDFVMGINEKKNYPQVLRECKYKMKKTKMPKFIGTELESESELESNAELEAKLKFDFDSE